MLSCSIRAYIHCPTVSGGLEALDQLQQRARNRVFLGIVMDLPSPRSIARLIPKELARGHYETPEYSRSYREIGAVDKSRFCFSDNLRDLWEAIEPSGSAACNRNLHSSQSA